jgi:hypothetical protein
MNSCYLLKDLIAEVGEMGFVVTVKKKRRASHYGRLPIQGPFSSFHFEFL